jgi:hypothetical protein
VFAHACKLGASGIVSERIDAPYQAGRHSVSGEHRGAAEAQREVD